MAQAARTRTASRRPAKARPKPPVGSSDDALEEAKTRALGERSVRLAAFYQGKVETVPKVPVRSLEDFSIWYTPGIAAVSRAIQQDPDRSFDLTGRWNTIAIVTDGTRVLGLGDVGPRAAMPVMEGKALLFKFLGGVDAIPLPLAVSTPEEMVETVERLAPAFGGINLEDIASPKCFQILEELSAKLPIPIWHDDQLGTAASTAAGLSNAIELTHRSLRSTRIVLLGAGAANIATARLLFAMGQDPLKLTLVDQRGVLHPDREDMDELMIRNKWKYRLALQTRGGGVGLGDLAEALHGADVLVAASTPVAGTVKPEWVRSMAPDPVVFALANPTPEIWPATARAAGAAVVATGRSDFPNQVNNSLVFPALFRGVLDARARSIPDEIVLAAVRELAARARDHGLSEEHILPTMAESDVFPHVAAAVAVRAVELGIARERRTREEFLERARELMRRPARLARELLRAGLTVPMPDETTPRRSRR